MVLPKFHVDFDSFHFDRSGSPNDGEQLDLAGHSNPANSHSFSPDCPIRLMLAMV